MKQAVPAKPQIGFREDVGDDVEFDELPADRPHNSRRFFAMRELAISPPIYAKPSRKFHLFHPVEIAAWRIEHGPDPELSEKRFEAWAQVAAYSVNVEPGPLWLSSPFQRFKAMMFSNTALKL